VQAAPVPLLQVDLSRTVLVIAGENQARTYASELGGDVQRLLNPGRLDDAMAAASAGNRSGLCDRARAVRERYEMSRAHPLCHLEGERPPREGNHPRTDVRR